MIRESTNPTRRHPEAVEHDAAWYAEMATLEALGLSHVQAWDVMRLHRQQAEAVATAVLLLQVRA